MSDTKLTLQLRCVAESFSGPSGKYLPGFLFTHSFTGQMFTEPAVALGTGNAAANEIKSVPSPSMYSSGCGWNRI